MSESNTPAQTDAAEVGLWERQPDGLIVLLDHFDSEEAAWKWLSIHHEGESWSRFHIGDDPPAQPPQLPFCITGMTTIVLQHKVLVSVHAAVYSACVRATDFAAIGDRSPALGELIRNRAKAARLLVASFDSLEIVAEMAGSRDPDHYALIHNRQLLPLVEAARTEADPHQAEPGEPNAVMLAVRFLAGVAETMNGEFPLLQR